MKSLFITPEIAWPPRNGGEIRKWNMLQAVLRCGTTDVVSFQQEGHPVAEQAYTDCRRIIAASQKHLHLGERQQQWYQSTVLRSALVLGSPLPIEYQGDQRAQLRARLAGELDFSEYDLVWYATARMAFPLGRLPIRHQILDGDDFSYVREWLLLRSSPFYGAKVWNYLDTLKLRMWEASSASRYSAVLRCSTEDQLRHPSPNVHVVPNGTVVPAQIERHPSRKALFVGELGYAPNEQGLRWFIELVWPAVRSGCPDAQLHIVGRKPPPSIAAHHDKNGIVVHGYVEDLDVLYAQSAISVVPLHAGGGTRLKIIESLARGTPVISTTIGAFGNEAGEQEGLVRTDEPGDFAARCVEGLSGRKSLEQHALQGRELMKRKYDWRIIQDQVEGIIRSLRA